MGKRDKNRMAPQERRQLFLQAIARGATVKEVAAAAGVDRTTPYQWARENANFKRDWDDMRAIRLQALQDAAYELAMDGNVVLIKFLLQHWEESASVRETGKPQQHQARINIITRGEADSNEPAKPFVELVNPVARAG